MIDYSAFLASLKGSALAPWLKSLPDDIAAGLDVKRYGDLPKWLDALAALPMVDSNQLQLKERVFIDNSPALVDSEKKQIESALRALIPWRKGPFHIHGTHIDTEWRSDWKWDRLLPHIEPLQGRTILDVGCGNGYHCWRMAGEGAESVIGIDPSPRFIVQFHMIKHFIDDSIGKKVNVLPLAMEQVPDNLAVFDTVFSMGVLYHRRSPMDHLKELQSALRPGGQLVLETLVIDGGPGDVLVPEGRYSMMNNVWFLPSVESLLSWLRKLGFVNAQVVDVNQTSCEEQRTTEWMKFHSLSNFLDPNDPSKTAEGHPAPLRAIIVANNPG